MELMQRTLYKIQIKVQIKIPEIVVSFATSNQREKLANLHLITLPIDDVSIKQQNLFDFS